MIQDHPHRTIAQLIRVLPLAWHDSILLKGWSLHQTRGASPYGNPTTNTDNLNGQADYGWLGQHQRLTDHQPGMIATIEMGARPYHPSIGRFLTIDPIEGGSCNDYDYTCQDPLNNLDLDGKMALPGFEGDCYSRLEQGCSASWQERNFNSRVVLWNTVRNMRVGDRLPTLGPAHVRHCVRGAILGPSIGAGARFVVARIFFGYTVRAAWSAAKSNPVSLVAAAIIGCVTA
jgi:RHS repeat-associated protein